MTLCVVVFKTKKKSLDLFEKLIQIKTPLSSYKLIKPKNISKGVSSDGGENLNPDPMKLPIVEISEVALLNPSISSSLIQKRMAFWLIPFGLIAGISFSSMTNLNTFSSLGLGTIGERLAGGLLGAASGWIGSYFAATTLKNEKKDDIRTLKKFYENNFWLLILETPLNTEMPWEIIQNSLPIEVLRLKDI